MVKKVSTKQIKHEVDPPAEIRALREQLNQSHVGTQTNVAKDAFTTQKVAEDIASDTINEAYSQKGLDTSATVNIDGEFDPGNTRIYSEFPNTIVKIRVFGFRFGHS